MPVSVLDQDAALLAGWSGTAPRAANEPSLSEEELLGSGAGAPAANEPRPAAVGDAASGVARPRPRPSQPAAPSRAGGSWLDRVDLRTAGIAAGGLVVALLVVLLAVSVLAGDDSQSLEFMGQTMAVDAEAGPRTVTDTTVAGFSRSPLGAALAAWHLSARSDAAAGPAIYGPTIRTQVVGDRAALLAQRHEQYAAWRSASKVPVPASSPIPATRNAVLGWAIPAWDDTAAEVVVELLVDCARCAPQPGPTRVSVTVRWDESAGDWRLVASAAFPSAPETDSARYTQFLAEEGQS